MQSPHSLFRVGGVKSLYRVWGLGFRVWLSFVGPWNSILAGIGRLLPGLWRDSPSEQTLPRGMQGLCNKMPRTNFSRVSILREGMEKNTESTLSDLEFVMAFRHSKCAMVEYSDVLRLGNSLFTVFNRWISAGKGLEFDFLPLGDFMIIRGRITSPHVIPNRIQLQPATPPPTHNSIFPTDSYGSS